MPRWYGEDVAYIHDVGHAEFALGSAPGILEILDHNGLRDGLVADLGCGSGLLARELVDAGLGTMERRIVSFRKVGKLYRRDEEVHRVRLYEPSGLSAELERAGFLVLTMHSYGDLPLSEGHAAFVANKPA